MISKGCDGMLLIDKLTNKVDFSKSEIIIADFIIQLGEKIKIIQQEVLLKKLIHHQRLF